MKCSDPACDYLTSEVIPALGHELSDWTPIDDSEFPDEKRSCSRCDYAETRPNPELNYAPSAELLQVKDGATSIVVLIHDDGYISSMTIADSILKKYGLVSDVALMTDLTWDSVAGAAKDTKYEALKNLLYNGRWGLINHSMSHSYWGSTSGGLSVDENKLYDEVVTSREILRNLFPGHRVLTFAYPGLSSVTGTYSESEVYKEIMELVSEYYVAGRFYSGGENALGGLNWENIGASGIGSSSVAGVLGKFAEASESPKFLVYFTHGIGATTPSSDISEEKYEELCAGLSAYVNDGSIWNAHFEDAVLYLREYETASLSVSGTREAISVTLTDTLDNEIYNYPLSVRLTVPKSFEAVKVVQGESITYAIAKNAGGEYVVDISVIPDGGVATVTPILASEVPTPDAPALPEKPESPEKPELADGLVVDSITDVSSGKGLSISTGLTETNNINIEYFDATRGNVIKVEKSDGSGKSFGFVPLTSDTMADALEVSFDIYIDSKYSSTYKDILYQLYFATIDKSPYYPIIRAKADGFCFKDIETPNGAVKWGADSKSISYDEWHTITIKINMTSKDAFVANYYSDGALVYTSTNYGNYRKNDNAEVNNYIKGVWFQTWGATKTLSYIDNISIKAGTLEAMGVDTEKTYHFENSLGAMSVSDSTALTPSLSKVGSNLTNCLSLIKKASGMATASFYLELAKAPVNAEAFSLEFDIFVDESTASSANDTLASICFGDTPDSPYAMTVKKQSNGFTLGESGALTDLLDYGVWYKVKLVVNNKVGEFKAYYFVDGDFVASSSALSDMAGRKLGGIRITSDSTVSYKICLDNIKLNYGSRGEIISLAEIYGIDLNYFPGYTRKAVTFTLDDGNIEMDSKVLSIMRPAGIKGTFNLIRTTSLSADEYRTLYEGYEIASHHSLHSLPWADGLNLSILPYGGEWSGSSAADPAKIYSSDREGYYYINYNYYAGSTTPSTTASWHTIVTNELYAEGIISTDAALEEVFGEGSVVGFAYPHGQYNEAVKQYLRDCGYLYARKTGTIAGTTGFALPEDRFAWTYNADHTNLISVMESFVNLKDDGTLKMFSFGVHSIDFNSAYLWDDLYTFAAAYGNRPDEFFYATNAEIFLYEDAIKAAVITEDRVINNSALTLYMEIGGVKMTLAPWSAYVIETGEVVAIEPSAAPAPSIPDEIEETPEEWLPGYVAPPVDPNPGESEDPDEPDEPIIPDTPTPPSDDEDDDDETENDDDFIDGGGWAPVGGND